MSFYQSHSVIIVIGSGISGLNFSLRAAEQGYRVVLITKKRVAESSTNYAQGGIAAVLERTDNFDQHVKDTLEAGAHHNDRRAVEWMVARGPEAIERLIELGVPFATKKNGALLLAREGGHHARRIAFVGDYTGKEIERVLVKKAKNHPLITILENTFAIDLLIKNNKCFGVQIFSHGKIENLFAAKTVLATGGIGQLYAHTTNPVIATGDGFAMAARAGLAFRDMEFIQFHPTALDIPSQRMFLISEAIRGEGAYLQNSKGERFMLNLHELAELAPRDIVARAIFKELKHGPIYIDLRHNNSSEIKTRFPKIYQTLKRYNLDLTKDLIPIAPAAHYCCGGIRVNLKGETALKNLYAFGEVAGTGVQGANRLASNSLLEALVFSDQVINTMQVTSYKLQVTTFKKPQLLRITNYELRKLNHIKKQIKQLMWNNVGIIRTDDGLQTAEEKLQSIQNTLNQFKGFHQLLWEVKNMAHTSLLITHAALSRQISLGCHFRVSETHFLKRRQNARSPARDSSAKQSFLHASSAESASSTQHVPRRGAERS